MMGMGRPKPLSEIVFDKYDTDKSGQIDIAEFRTLCYALGYALTAVEVELAVKVLDTDASGQIEKKEFTKWWAKSDRRWDDVKLDTDTLEKRNAALEAFKTYDPNKTGKIEKANFERLHGDLVKGGLTKKALDRFLEDLDSNRDGAIEFGEYLDWLARQGTLPQRLPEAGAASSSSSSAST